MDREEAEAAESRHPSCTGSASLEGHGEEAGSQAKSCFLDFARILLADLSEAAGKLVPALHFLLLQHPVAVN
ncbi:hypothetical protein A6R68_20911, partial [Neotoma lepida]